MTGVARAASGPTASDDRPLVADDQPLAADGLPVRYPYLVSVRRGKPVPARLERPYYVTAYPTWLGIYWHRREVEVLAHDPQRDFFREQRDARYGPPSDPEPAVLPSPDAPAARNWFLSAEELAATRAKLATIDARARRKGFTGEVFLDAVPATRAQPTPGGLSVVVHGFDVTITGTPPAYQGWQFVAAVDRVDGGGTVLRFPPGHDGDVPNATVEAGRCDHCHTTRARRSTILVRHDETGELLQVGRSCVKDFLGHDTSPVFLSVDEVRDTLARGVSGAATAWDTASVIAYAHAAVAAFGWTPAAAFGRVATRDQVRSLLTHARDSDELLRAIAPHLPEAQRVAPTIIATLLDRLTAPTGYEANLTTVLRADAVSARHLGLAVSAIPAFARLAEPAAPDAATATPQAPAEWLGTVGDTVTVTGVVRTALRVDGYTRSSPKPLLVVLECPGAVVKLTTTARWADGVHRGDPLTLTGTVKAHTEWNGTRQTVLSRPKPVTTEPQAGAPVSPDAATPVALSDAAAPAWERVAPTPGRRPPRPGPSPVVAPTLSFSP